MTTTTWNTGRLYTNEGQVIVATKHDDGVVTFMDHSRGISGELNDRIADGPSMGRVEGWLERLVMNAYDHNEYKNSSRAWADGMQRDGCNAKRS